MSTSMKPHEVDISKKSFPVATKWLSLTCWNPQIDANVQDSQRRFNEVICNNFYKTKSFQKEEPAKHDPYF